MKSTSLVLLESETWCVLKKDGQEIVVWERKILGRMFKAKIKMENGENSNGNCMMHSKVLLL